MRKNLKLNFLTPAHPLLTLFFWGSSFAKALARAGGGGGGMGGGGSYFGHYWTISDYWGALFVGSAFAAMAFLSIGYVRWRVARKTKKVGEVLKQLALKDRKWDEKNLEKTTGETFLDIQKNWCGQDLNKLRKSLTPALYGEWEDKIKFYQQIGQRNHMDQLTVNRIQVVEVKNFKDHGKDSFTACIDAGAVDYFTDDKGDFFSSDNNSPLKTRDGLRFQKFREFWTFIHQGSQGWILNRVDQEGEWADSVNEAVVNEA